MAGAQQRFMSRDGKDTPTTIATLANQALAGLVNFGEVTLAANATSTAVSVPGIGPDAFFHITPLTANAAAALANTYISARVKNQVTLTHADNAQTDRTFIYTWGTR